MKSLFYALIAVSLCVYSCSSPGTTENENANALAGLSAEEAEKKLLEMFLTATEGSTINIPEGTFRLTQSLPLDGIDGVTIKGAGKGKTILSFKGQEEGAEGLKITANKVVIEDLRVEDSAGDAIKVKGADGVTFRNVDVTWTNGPDEKNGAYGLYPVECKNVLIEGCDVSGASDAGIYVGQSDNIIVRNNRAYQNVAGIEIENCNYADVYDNIAEDNTGGVLVFDMPDLPQVNGKNVRVFNNQIIANNYRNFAPEGNIVGSVPAGTGIIVMAAAEVDIYDNEVIDHKTVGAAIVSYLVYGKPYKDEKYDPYSTAIYIHNNNFETSIVDPDTTRELGLAVSALFGGDIPTIIFDGAVAPEHIDADGNVAEEVRICVQNNGSATFANLDFLNEFENLDTNIENYNCEHEPQKPVTL